MEYKSLAQLQKNLRKDAGHLMPYKLGVIGDCSTQLLCQAIKGTAYDEGIGLELFEADYNQAEAQLSDPASEYHKIKPKSVLLYFCTQRLYEDFCACPLDSRSGFAEAQLLRLSRYWEYAGTTVLQTTFIESDDSVFGGYAGKTGLSFLYQVKKLNLLIMDACQKQSYLYPVDINGLVSRLGTDKTCDARLYYHAKMPLAVSALPVIAKAVTDTVRALMGSVKKCVVCDLDNTLWGGVVGDEGLEGIRLGELGDGMAYTALQRWLRELKNRGVILAVCSKNEEATAKEPFIKHPDMILRLEDISCFIANWEDKATNIRRIRDILDIGMDSMVFLDDNPFEREAVRSLIPDITVPELPLDPAMYLPFLQSLNIFETASFSEEDLKRTERYRAESGRVMSQADYQSYDDYLNSLGMEAEVGPFTSFWFPRIAQLTQRSNQFNLRTVRCSEAEISALASDTKYITLYFTLRDKFGDYGLIGVVVLEKRADCLFIGQWLMSCRVLKRGMEEFIADKIIKTAAEAGFDTVIGEYIATKKNAMVSGLYEKMGFKALGNGLYEAKTGSYKPHKTYINEVL